MKIDITKKKFCHMKFGCFRCDKNKKMKCQFFFFFFKAKIVDFSH